MRPLALIVALARNRGIGLRGALPWHVPEDLMRFKALTMGHAIVMGRKTHESIGRALPGRRNLVLTRGSATFDGCETVNSLEQALKLTEQDELPFIIGGSELYAEALPTVTHLFFTQLDRDVEADTFFPELTATEWTEVKREPGTTPGVNFVDLRRNERP